MNKFEGAQQMFSTDFRQIKKSIPDQAWEQSLGDVGVNAVFGISETELPARFLAGFIPAFILTETLQSQNKPVKASPVLRVFFPCELASACGIQTEHTANQSRLGMEMIEGFRFNFHPSVPLEVDIENLWTRRHVNHLNFLTVDMLHDSHDAIDPEWKQIALSALRRGHPETAWMYAAHGVFGWQDLGETDEIRFFNANPRFITINVMSRSEKPFRVIHEAIVNQQKTQTTLTEQQNIVSLVHIDLFTTVCNRPHYQRVDIGSHQEPSIDDLLLFGFEKVHQELTTMKDLSPKFKQALKDLDLIKWDIETLRSHDPSLPNIEEFIQEVKRVDQS